MLYINTDQVGVQSCCTGKATDMVDLPAIDAVIDLCIKTF
jgi:hypothetical protein